MLTIEKRNVNGLFTDGMLHLSLEGERMSSRAGDVIVMPFPVMSVYRHPQERVLFNERRDANPFFHLFEGLWMLAGCNDAASLNRYVKDFGARFAEKDGTIHGAYGHRWREAFGVDQLETIVARLRKNPDDRQAVLQMWDCTSSYHSGHGDLDADINWKDRPCNTHVYFRVRQQERTGMINALVLDMTILCRSNDIVWGAYGANAVHFSMLMEYVAGRVGCEMGIMYQFSNNYHGYVDQLDRLGDPSELEIDDKYESVSTGPAAMKPMPMGTNWDAWDADLRKFMEWHRGGARNPHFERGAFVNDWFLKVAVPMCRANSLRVDGDMKGALEEIDHVEANDWHQAGRAWLQRRMK